MTLLAKRLNGTTLPSVPRTLLDDVFGFAPLHHVGTDIEIARTENGFVVEIPMPGFKQGEIEVKLDQNTLSLSAKNERRKASRALVIPEDIDSEHIDVSYESGMLTVRLQTHPRAIPKKIDVRYNE